MSDNIKVVVKVRPLISREIDDKLSYQWRVKNNTLYQLDQNGKDLGQSFTFDKVYDKDTKTKDVYDDIAKPIVQAATAGFNGTIFAYGQTSSGKTYTMTGTDSSPGIIPLAVINLFKIIKNVPDRDFLVRVSYIEIYNETVKDLLDVEKDNIKIHESLQGIKVDATERVTSSPEEVLEAMKEGEANRQKGATNMNEESSRSHSIFQIIIESREHIEGEEEEVGCVNVSQLNLVDLAGSERAGQTGATGKRFIEGTHINKSLSALALVIKQLSENKTRYANYRDSKLTRILQNSLGGNAKTSIICAVTPAAVEETISTLQFANRAKAIKNKPEVNAVATDKTMIQSLTKQMCILQAQLESKKNLEQDNHKLQNKIANLQKLILNGFAQRRSVDLISGTRRKLQQPRRITISTFPSIDDEPVVNIPKFCTPSLKYNPMSIPNPADFVPIQTAGKLASVPEEPVRLITPPPTRAVNFRDEVIELDSDDDSTRDEVQTRDECSPIHKCYGASKTPPCKLREIAERAERELKDIVELSEREKLFTPSVVEYMEKLEKKTTELVKLQDQIEELNKRSKEKDLELDNLKTKIKTTEEELKASNVAKMHLQTQCDNYNTKLTDVEVSYETLRNKAKLREEELLSLLEELNARNKKPEDIGKLLSRTLDKEVHFMDISKDISLVNSDTEGSIVNTNDDELDHVNDMITDSQTQLTLRNQAIIELEADLFTHKQKISSLENMNQELQDKVVAYKEKLANIENDNSLLKSTIDTLNCSIKSHKENLETASSDIESYNNLIQELQIKVSQKQSLPSINIDDSVLENMIANEEKFIANNENMKNIVHSLKMALDVRNKEIHSLKSTHQNNKDETLDTKKLIDQLETKSKEVNTLGTEMDNLKKQVNENIAMITKLMHEKNDLKDAENELFEKLAAFEDKSSKLQKLNSEYMISIEKMKEENDNLTVAITDKKVFVQELSDNNQQLVKQIEDMENKIADLEKEIRNRDDLISSLQTDNKQSKECLLTAKAAVFKSQVILGTLSGNIQEVPEVIDNFVNIFSILEDSMNTLENVANDIVTQKEEAIKNNAELKVLLEQLSTKHDSEVAELKGKLNCFSTTEYNDLIHENDTLTKRVNQLTSELDISHKELDTKIFESNTLKANLDHATENIKARNQEISALKTEINNLDQTILNKENIVINLTKKNTEIERVLDDKVSEINAIEKSLNKLQKERDELLIVIYRKINEITTNSKIYTDIEKENDIDCVYKIHEQILITLDKIGNHITFICSKNVDDDNEKVSEALLESKKEIVEISQQNLNLLEQLSEIENKNTNLSIEIKNIKSCNKNLNTELLRSQEILQNLHTELKLKSNELTTMKDKVQDWKEQFTNLEHLMEKQMYEWKWENESLRAQISNLKKEHKASVFTYEHKDFVDIDNQNACDKKHLSDLCTCTGRSSPPSLVTICCNQILDFIHPKEVDSKTTTASSIANVSVQSDETYIVKCKCNELSLELKVAREENSRIIDLLEQLELVNQHLIEEQEKVRNEIEFLVAPAQELQKKIFNHKTNLAILTATTYAENRSLKSQVKVLQHHHSRFHNVCQRDIAGFKNQLRELCVLLKGEPCLVDKQNASFKRFSLPDVLDSSTALPNLKNESTLDGDLLMLDTNITLTTAADNTLTGHDQTCLDLTQFYEEASCQTNEPNQISYQNIQHMEILSHDNQSISDKLKLFKDENLKLREQLDKYTEIKQLISNDVIKNYNKSVDSINAPYECIKCKKESETQNNEEKLNEELKSLALQLTEIKTQKADIEQKYNNLILETPNIDTLVKRLSILEKEYNSSKQEISKLHSTLSLKKQEFNKLQHENDTLSNQVMDHISEADELCKEVKLLKQSNCELLDKCSKLEQLPKESNCPKCLEKDQFIQIMQQRLAKPHSKLNRSLSDSDTSSRYNKICTLQSELHAGREDCKELTEDVVTIKNHLDRNNLSMDLDDSMGETNIYMLNQNFALTSPQSSKCKMPDIPEERPSDVYLMDKTDCLNYYAEQTGVEKDNLNRDLKMIELMKMFYEYFITKHTNEVENLTNKLKDYDESKSQLEIKFCNLVQQHSQVSTELKQKEINYTAVSNVLSRIKNNMHILNQDIINATNIDNLKLVNMYKDKFLKVLDELNLSSVTTFESLINNIVNKHETDLNKIIEQYTILQQHMESVSEELNSVNENLTQMKTQLSAKENEYNLLKAQKDRIHEISNAVTLDIIKKEKELAEIINNGYQKLVDLNIIKYQNIDLTLPLNMNVNNILEHLINQHKYRMLPDIEKEKDALSLEVKESKQIIEEQQQQLKEVQTRSEKIQEINNDIRIHIVEKDNKLRDLTTLHEDLNKIYESKVEENKANLDIIEKLCEEIKLLKSTVEDKEITIKRLETEINAQSKYHENEAKIIDLKETVKVLQDDIVHLKAMNEVILKEKDAYAKELQRSGETINKNIIEMDKMTSDILVLRESVKENSFIIDNLNTEAKNVMKQNIELKQQLEERCKECLRLDTNIKTHEKTAEIQTRMIMRLEKQKTEDDKVINDKNKYIEELTLKCASLQKQCDALQSDVKDMGELEQLRKTKEILETRVSELEALLVVHKSRPSIDAIADSSRRRRQSLHDSKRLFAEDRHEFGDHNNVEAVFDSRAKPDDLFMDVDEDVSNRSTPIRLSKGRDSLSLSRTDQSDKDEEHPSRPSSVIATRRRRQSTHDMHRSVIRHTPSPHGLESSNRIIDEFNHSKPSNTSGGIESEVSQLRERLNCCQQELEDLKEKYRELDEECETCAEYLRERDEQCARLKKEKSALQVTITELKEKLNSPNLSQQNGSKPSVAHVAVNTDEDWTNLHSVVVDRMSFDAEVEKNKRLTKTIEELRFKKQDLKNTLSKMQKVLERNSSSRELESTKQELHACKQELSQLRVRYKELDEECETCAQYLREKEEQCRRLKEAKNALEAKLQEFQGDHCTMTHSTRKKRQSLHDQNRGSPADVRDAFTETSDDFLSYQVERDGSYRSLSEDMETKELRRLKSVVEKLSQQKAMLEQQLVNVSAAMHASHPMYVATGSGIVQNQQLTDVMKENQKLKRMNAKLVNICKKRGKESNRENEDPADQG